MTEGIGEREEGRVKVVGGEGDLSCCDQTALCDRRWLDIEQSGMVCVQDTTTRYCTGPGDGTRIYWLFFLFATL